MWYVGRGEHIVRTCIVKLGVGEGEEGVLDGDFLHVQRADVVVGRLGFGDQVVCLGLDLLRAEVPSQGALSALTLGDSSTGYQKHSLERHSGELKNSVGGEI